MKKGLIFLFFLSSYHKLSINIFIQNCTKKKKYILFCSQLLHSTNILV